MLYGKFYGLYIEHLAVDSSYCTRIATVPDTSRPRSRKTINAIHPKGADYSNMGIHQIHLEELILHQMTILPSSVST